VPEMTRGRGVRLQRYKEKGLADVATFKGSDGLTWIDTAGRSFALTLKELANWCGDRGAAGRVRPDRFLTNNKFNATPGAGKTNGGEEA
jgi:topoisomerase IV subunit A